MISAMVLPAPLEPAREAAREHTLVLRPGARSTDSWSIMEHQGSSGLAGSSGSKSKHPLEVLSSPGRGSCEGRIGALAGLAISLPLSGLPASEDKYIYCLTYRDTLWDAARPARPLESLACNTSRGCCLVVAGEPC